jgi:hypothetical protein
MDRIWLKDYPPGVPAEIDMSRYASLVAIIDESCAKYREHEAFVCMDKAISYGELDELSCAFGAWLQSKGLVKGARVAIMMPNVLQYPVAIVGILRAGYAVVNTNPLYTARELESQLKDSGAEAVIVLENFANTVQQAIAKTGIKHVIVASMGDLLGTVKGTIVNLVVRHVKKMVPAYALPDATPFNAVIAAGKTMTLAKPEIGPNEVNLLRAGANYGWPIVSFGREYAGPRVSERTWAEGMDAPVVFWVPSIAVSGMTFYSGDRFPSWRGNLLAGGLQFGRIAGTGQVHRIVFNDDQEEIRREALLLELRQRIRNVEEGPDGLVYVLTDEDPGAVLRIEPASE